MNEAVLKTSTVGVIALAVSSAVWLAGSLQTSRPSAPRLVAAPTAVPQKSGKPMLLVAALPAERAASASLVRTVGVR
ncbi:hypothetical protein [Roseateles violae]|uniref:Flp pilus assembly protein CpaB n=1 Tax=Roseateles violae TaxID=3058042 RepID=A0ABT8DN18_9BURK|nr:hypothetical protein [Pelomonas sp. PFR6]MDN3919338.1 hypothetical protein [Pelomonas sp. PFR6]